MKKYGFLFLTTLCLIGAGGTQVLAQSSGNAPGQRSMTDERVPEAPQLKKRIFKKPPLYVTQPKAEPEVAAEGNAEPGSKDAGEQNTGASADAPAEPAAKEGAEKNVFEKAQDKMVSEEDKEKAHAKSLAEEVAEAEAKFNAQATEEYEEGEPVDSSYKPTPKKQDMETFKQDYMARQKAENRN